MFCVAHAMCVLCATSCVRVQAMYAGHSGALVPLVIHACTNIIQYLCNMYDYVCNLLPFLPSSCYMYFFSIRIVEDE